MECNASSRPMPLDICGTFNCETEGKKIIIDGPL